MVDYSQMSTEELMALYKQPQQPQQVDYSSMSTEELKAIYDQNRPEQPQQRTPNAFDEFDEMPQTPLRAQVNKEQRDPLKDTLDAPLSAISGLSKIPAAGINTLTGGASREFLSPLVDYQPRSWLGKALKTGGEFAPYLATKAVSIPAQAAIGAVQGYTSAVNEGKDLKDIAWDTATGGIIGAAGGATLGYAGKAFEKAQPYVSEFMSGIPKEDYIRVMESVKTGEKPFSGNFKDISTKAIERIQKQAADNVNKASWGLTEKTNIPYKKLKTMIEDIKSKTYQGADTSEVVNKTSQALTDAEVDHLIIPSLQNKYNPDELLSIKNLLKQGATLEDLGVNPDIINIKPANINAFKKAVDMKINWNTEDKAVNDFYKQIRRQPDELLRESSPEFAKANDINSQVQGLLENPKNAKLQDNKHNDELVKELQLLQSRKQFEKYAPHYTDDKGRFPIAQSVGIGALTGGSFINPTLLAILPLLSQASPRVQKEILKAYGTGTKTSPYFTRIAQQALYELRGKDKK